jgi:hypothetical protein
MEVKMKNKKKRHWIAHRFSFVSIAQGKEVVTRTVGFINDPVTARFSFTYRKILSNRKRNLFDSWKNACTGWNGDDEV